MVCDFGIGWIALMLLYQQLKVRQKKGYKRNLYKEKDGWADGSNCDYSAHSACCRADFSTALANNCVYFPLKKKKKKRSETKFSKRKILVGYLKGDYTLRHASVLLGN